MLSVTGVFVDRATRSDLTLYLIGISARRMTLNVDSTDLVLCKREGTRFVEKLFLELVNRELLVN